MTRTRIVQAWALVLLVSTVPLSKGAEVETGTDEMGRVVYRSDRPVPTDQDRDLRPTPLEDLVQDLRRLPAGGGNSPGESVPFADLIREGALTYGVDPALVEAVMATESSFNPFAVSQAGAIGLMQLMPETADRYGVQDIFDPRENVLAGTEYLSYLLSLFDGDLDRALAGYNAGENAVLQHGGVPPYAETRDYVRRVRRYLVAIRRRAAAEDSAEASKSPPSPDWLLRPSPPAATIYHYVDEHGVVHFTNQKPEVKPERVHVWHPGP